MTYNLEELKKKINALAGNSKGGDKAKIVWAKFDIGSHDIRFVPLTDANGNPHSQPFFEVTYYDNKDLGDRRFVAPSQFGAPDPLRECAMELAKDKSKEAWLIRKKLTAKERYYAPIIVRGQEEKGVQVWEISPKLCKDIYGLLVHPDYQDEDMFSVDSGYDFTVNVAATDKMFNNYPVKEIKIQPRRKASKLLPKKEDVEKALKQVPNFEAYFKAQVKSEEEMIQIRDNFLAVQSADPNVGTTTAEGTTRGSADNTQAAADVDAAFKDLE